eukprot:scaffold7525_cov57-Skeletonema_menzelii.AAC.1
MQVGVQFGTAVRVPMDLEPKKCTEAEVAVAAAESLEPAVLIHKMSGGWKYCWIVATAEEELAAVGWNFQAHGADY